MIVGGWSMGVVLWLPYEYYCFTIEFHSIFLAQVILLLHIGHASLIPHTILHSLLMGHIHALLYELYYVTTFHGIHYSLTWYCNHTHACFGTALGVQNIFKCSVMP